MEKTRLFQEHVKFIKAHKKQLDIKSETIKLSKKGEFVKKIESILGQIAELREFLLNYKEKFFKLAYDSVTSLVISDTELEKVDMIVQRITEHCFNSLKDLSSYIMKTTMDHHSVTQHHVHQKMLIELIRNYLTSLYKLYLEYKTVCVKRNNHYYRMISITSSNFNSKFTPDKETTTKQQNIFTPDTEIRKDEISDETADYMQNTSALPDCELKVLDTENNYLLDELNGLLSEVGHIEKKVSSLMKLQETFTNEVLQQDHQIQRIDNTVSSASQNVQDANFQLKEALQNTASLRIYLLHIILGLCFSLLFLNWYND